jgi:hypothetical protein
MTKQIAANNKFLRNVKALFNKKFYQHALLCVNDGAMDEALNDLANTFKPEYREDFKRIVQTSDDIIQDWYYRNSKQVSEPTVEPQSEPAAKPSLKIGDTVVISFKDTPISEHGVIIDKQGDEFVVQAKDHLGTLHYRKASELASPTVIDDITPAEPQTTSELETLQAENAKLRAQLEIAVQALKQHRTYVNRIGLQSSVRLMNETLAKIETLNS